MLSMDLCQTMPCDGEHILFSRLNVDINDSDQRWNLLQPLFRKQYIILCKILCDSTHLLGNCKHLPYLFMTCITYQAWLPFHNLRQMRITLPKQIFSRVQDKPFGHTFWATLEDICCLWHHAACNVYAQRYIGHHSEFHGSFGVGCWRECPDKKFFFPSSSFKYLQHMVSWSWTQNTNNILTTNF